MFVYSEKIIQFVSEIKGAIKAILSREIRLKVSGNRFYEGRYSYPIKIVIFNSGNHLGYFDADFYELGFHERLMYSSKEQLLSVIRHELAHYMTFIKHGMTEKPHCEKFKAFCQKHGWGEEVYSATLKLDENQEAVALGSIHRKVQKLMALSTSSNKNEAELAMIKSQQLLLKHNIDSLHEEEGEKSVLKRIMKQTKRDAKMDAIARILETFFVSVVFNRGQEYSCLDILGSQVNVEIAEYVATILVDELDKLWLLARKESSLKGAVAKNSFFRGIAKGYCEKIKALKRDYSSEVSGALMVLENQLLKARSMAYGRLSSAKLSGNHCSNASSVGEKMGKGLTINPALGKGQKQQATLSLNFLK